MAMYPGDEWRPWITIFACAAVVARMEQNSNRAVAISSTLLRAFSYLFLRWIPGHHFPPMILTLAAIYGTTFVRSFLSSSPFEIVADEIDIITRETDQAYGSDDDEKSPAKGKHETLQELDATETVKLKARSLQPLKSLVLGLPSPVSLLWTFVTGSINFALVLMVLDMVYRAPLLHEEHNLVFSRVGYVSHESARILVREPRVSELPLFLSYRQSGVPVVTHAALKADSTWKHVSQISDLTLETDFTGSAEITNLVPDTEYQYVWSNNRSGMFTTASAPGQMPRDNNNTFTFLFSSCIKPRVPYSPLDHPLHFKGLQHIASAIPMLQPQFMLFLGDFIYIDVPKRLGISPETYRAEYRRVYSSPDWPTATQNLPWLHVIDDHEIANDWDGNTTGLYAAAADPWHHYQVVVNPPALQEGATFFAFTQGPIAVFMLDTRRYRTPESKNATDPLKSMLGLEQLKHLLDWIASPQVKGVRWKIIVSSVPFTKNWRFGDTDTWGTYLHERQLVLEAAWRASLSQGVGMIVISGDRHEFAATRLVDDTDNSQFKAAEVMEFSVSPLNMFYLPTRTYYQRDEADQQVGYIPAGNSKYGAMQFSVHSDGSAVLDFRLFVDGREKYAQRVVAPKRK